MSNGIAERQNTKKNICRLAAQRQLYNVVGWIDTVLMVATVLLPLLYSFMSKFVLNSVDIKTVIAIYSLLMLLVLWPLRNLKKNKRELAAAIQQEFDIEVYQMPWDDKLFGKRKNLNAEIADASKKILDNAKEKQKLYNWYAPEVEALSIEEGIAACQKENFNWDAGLRKRYRLFVKLILAIIIIIPICICLVKGQNVQELILKLYSLLPIFVWCANNINGLNEDLKRMIMIEKMVYSVEKKDISELQTIQKEIYNNRKTIIKIPNWFYDKYKDNDEDRERRTLQL